MARHLLVTNDFPPKTGGIQVYLYELWRRLEPGRGVVLTANSHADARQFDAENEIVVERVAATTLFFPTPRVLRAIEDAIARHQPDLVLLDPAWPLGLLGPRLSRPYGVVLHGAEVAVPGRIPFASSSLRYVLRHASVALCAGEYPESEARRVAAEHMPPVIQVPPGVDTNVFRPLTKRRRTTVRKSFGFSDDDLLVCSYSRLVPRKGMDTLIRASVELASDFPQLRVVIGGSGRDQRRLQALANRLKAPVTFLGRVPDERLGDWLASNDLMVMDCRSRWLGLEQEGFGIVFLNAAASGIAQVAGRSGGSHEAVRDGVTGYVVDKPRRAHELALTMAALLGNDALREQFGQQAREEVVANFDWEQLAASLRESLAPFDGFGVTNRLA
jgi:phosphatidylinositol alpha-1,6-mannosyltransferase